ncbi:hypothetical protein KAW18_02065 [candidate division WOR-3 bacterium]|nr:hypothetical protein [candidate division WOR-3 bacterium]
MGLFDVMSKIKEDGLKVVKQQMRHYYNVIIEQGKTVDETHDIIIKLYKDAVVSTEKNPFNFDMCVSIHEYEDYYYLIPYGVIEYDRWDFLDNNPQLEEFGYYNNTDKPENVSDRDWDDRELIWNAIIDVWERQLVCIISEYDDFWRISPWLDLKREEFEKSKKESI